MCIVNRTQVLPCFTKGLTGNDYLTRILLMDVVIVTRPVHVHCEPYTSASLFFP